MQRRENDQGSPGVSLFSTGSIRISGARTTPARQSTKILAAWNVPRWTIVYDSTRPRALRAEAQRDPGYRTGVR